MEASEEATDAIVKKGKKGKGKGKAANGGQVVYARQDRRSGIHTIEIYQPQFYFKQTEMEEYDAQPDRYGPSVIGKYTKGIGQIEGRLPADDEDPISFALTSLHRLMDRIEQNGLNETGRYQPDGKALPLWNSVGRLDIGSESLVDRSKSMKSYVMDLFERYGQETDIEGVDQYNACYGGQACGLAVENWVEGDRWDGRYGIAISTDISDVDHAIVAFGGSATTAALFFPDAPLAHHSIRASCIMHRFDFFKPVGWFSMAPLSDGKYSVEAYMDAAELCFKNLWKKMGRGPLSVTDYNVFHTGGGYHIVKKVFTRTYRTEFKDSTKAEMEADVEKRLHPSCHLLKHIGPCHTVSSFLNISSTVMCEWDKALGKVILVYTYGSGCASSMYQLRVDDIALMDPLEVWRVKFYRNAIYMKPWEMGRVHQYYVDTWMLFDWLPVARKKEGIPAHKYELDVYYILSLDIWGRRYYHRGGIMTDPLPTSVRLRADAVEHRVMREDLGPKPTMPVEDEKSKALKYDLSFEESTNLKMQVVGTYENRYQEGQTEKIMKLQSSDDASQDPAEFSSHSYQIVGSWTGCEDAQSMKKMPDGSFTFQVTIGENRWEHFNFLQDGDDFKCIYPFYAKSGQRQRCCGPGKVGQKQRWLLDCRDRATTPPADVAMPGEQFLITLAMVSGSKEVTWKKIEGSRGEVVPSKYFIVGENDERIEMASDPEEGDGWYTSTMPLSKGEFEFSILRNGDPCQRIFPQPFGDDATIDLDTPISGPGEGTTRWKLTGKTGSYRILFYRDPEDCEPSGMRIDWEMVE